MNFRLRYRYHLRQFLIILSIALFGLGMGSLYGVQGLREKASLIPTPVSPSPKPLANVLPSPELPIVISITPSPSPAAKSIKKAAKAPALKVKRSFNWGVTIQPFPFRENNTVFLSEQFRLAQELSLKAVRVEYSPNNQPANQQAVDLAKERNLQLVFIIPFGPNDIFSDQQLFDNAYQYVAEAVNRYKGQVPVWQLATEVASVAIIDGGHHGVDRVDYPENKYQAVATWLKAATKAVKDTDPSAKRLVNDQWVHVGFFDRFLAEGGDFDILGWNWFSDMGKDIQRPVLNSKTGQRYNLMKKLKSYNKELWLTEVNRRGGSKDGDERAQADYIQFMAETAYAEPAVTGFFVYNLVEDQTAPPAEQGYSLVNIDQDKQWVAGPKEAFNRYQALIKAKQ